MLIQSALMALAATAVGAVKSLEIQGLDFFNPDTGEKFQIVGMAYQPGGSSGYNPKTGKDPLSDSDTCLRDAALMQILGINTIRVYNLDPDVNHDACASIFNAAGIYMVLDVNSPLVGQSLTTYNPWESYYKSYLNRTFAIVEAFSNYPNTLAFFSANEVIQKVQDAKDVPPYIRAVTRDLKTYIKKHIKRAIPVGYSAADVRDVLWDTWNYMQCAEDGKSDDISRVDLFALNSYSWCGPAATFKSSTYEELTDKFKSSSVPVFFSEYGCNKDPPRLWKETHTLYGSEMTPSFSGGIVYQWTQEDNDFGIVNITGDTLNLMGDYNRLKNELSTLDWKSIQSNKATKKSITPPECSSKLIQEHGFDSNFTLPVVPGDGSLKVLDNGVSPKPSGKIIKISDYNVKMIVKDENGKTITGLKVVPLPEDEFNWYGKNGADTGKSNNTASDSESHTNSSSSDNSDQSNGDENAAMLMRPLLWTAALPVLAMIFA